MSEIPKTLMFSMGAEASRRKKQNLEISNPKIEYVFLKWVVDELSYDCQFRDRIFHKFLPGRLVFLYGTSNAGKSSIISHIKRKFKLKSEEMVVTGTDPIWALHIFDLFVQFSPKKARYLHAFLSLDDIFDCLWNPLLFPKLIKEYDIARKHAEKLKIILDEFRIKQKTLLNGLRSSKRPLFCAASFLPALSSGKVVFVDCAADPGDIDEFYQAMLSESVHCRIDIVIIYCSPRVLMERLYARNENAISSLSINKGRPGAFPLEQFTVLYKTTENVRLAIDRVNLSDIIVPDKLPNICRRLSEMLARGLDSPLDNYNEKEWTETQTLVQKHLGIHEEGDEVNIVPKCDYHFMVNSGEEDAVTCSEKILKTLRI